MSPKRLVCVVEGRGEVAAMPTLCARILQQRLLVPPSEWVVDREPVRHPRSRLVDESVPAPNRPPREETFRAALELAARRSDAVLVTVDADKDCAVRWGLPAATLVRRRTAGGAVMAVNEYEAWLLAGLPEAFDGESADDVANPKARLRRWKPDYRETLHQVALTRQLDLSLAHRRSRSFRKLESELRSLVEAHSDEAQRSRPRVGPRRVR